MKRILLQALAVIILGERGAVGQRGILVHNGKKKGVEEHPTFIADHPFLFLIKDEPTGSVLFMGRVMDPGEE
jgi:serine protease inhibitor